MAITPPAPPKTAEEKQHDKKVEDWIKAAPDGRGEPEPPKRKGVRKGNKDQITHAFKPEVLEQLEEFAKRHGLKRAGAIDLAVHQLLRDGIRLEGNNG